MIEVKRPGDFLKAFIQEKYGVPDNWWIAKWERKNYAPTGGRGPNEFMLVTGAVCPEVYKSGPRKGSENWSKRDRSTEMVAAVILSDLDAFELEWEQKTGLCKTCVGSGQEWRGWNRKTGDRFEECRRCGGTGKVKAFAA